MLFARVVQGLDQTNAWLADRDFFLTLVYVEIVVLRENIQMEKDADIVMPHAWIVKAL